MARSILVAQSDQTLVNLQTLMLKRAGNIVAKVSDVSTLAVALQQYTFEAIVYDVQIDPRFEVLRQYAPLLRDSNTALIVTAFDESHVRYCKDMGLTWTTIAPTAVTELSRLILTVSPEARSAKA